MLPEQRNDLLLPAVLAATRDVLSLFLAFLYQQDYNDVKVRLSGEVFQKAQCSVADPLSQPISAALWDSTGQVNRLFWLLK